MKGETAGAEIAGEGKKRNAGPVTAVGFERSAAPLLFIFSSVFFFFFNFSHSFSGGFARTRKMLIFHGL